MVLLVISPYCQHARTSEDARDASTDATSSAKNDKDTTKDLKEATLEDSLETNKQVEDSNLY